MAGRWARVGNKQVDGLRNCAERQQIEFGLEKWEEMYLGSGYKEVWSRVRGVHFCSYLKIAGLNNLLLI